MFRVDPPSSQARPTEVKDTFADAFTHTFKSLSMDGVAMNNPQLIILPDEHSSQLGHYGKMLLGMKQLSHLHLYIAYKEQILYVTSAEAGAP
jgi:hypothetical protein